jgi:hypothetical protein
MSVVSVNELPPERGERSNITSLTRTFQVLTDAATDGPETILQDGRIPTLYSAYVSGTEFNGSALCNNRIATRSTESRTVWTVTAEYDTQQSRKHGNDHEEDNPLLRPALYEWDAILSQKIAVKNLIATASYAQDAAITNSAGFLFDPPPMIDDARRVLRVTRNEWPFNEQSYAAFDNAVNLYPWRGYAARTWKSLPIKATGPQRENGVDFWQVRYEFHYNKRTWDTVTLDAGFVEKVSSDFKQILDKNGDPVTQPWPLNGAGGKLTDPSSQASQKYLTAICYETADFNTLGIF